MRRDTFAAVAAIVAVIVVILLGFHFLGSPGSQRLIQSDMRTVQALCQLAQQIQIKAHDSNNEIPANLDSIPDDSKRDPVSRKPFLYTPKSRTSYDLCATFQVNSPEARLQPNSVQSTDGWSHPAGDYCFPLDASKPVPPAPYFN
jgi:hypothetical protein